MKKRLLALIFPLVFGIFFTSQFALASNPEIFHYGHFKKMMHKQQTDGVVELAGTLASTNVFAVGAIQGGIGEITVMDGELWLDYGKNGIGKSVNTVPAGEKAVLLVTANVAQWQEVKVPDNVGQKELQTFILTEANKQGLRTDKPFPFLLEGTFDNLMIHVIAGKNPHFSGQHGKGKGGFLKKIKETRENQQGRVIGFYSAQSHGVFTHPNEYWHLHVVLEEENIGAHVDSIRVKKDTILKLPR